MPELSETRFQIGKNGITEGVIESINKDLKNHRRIRISALQSSGRDKEKIKQMAEQIKDQVGFKTEYRILGFTIILIKQ